MGGGCTEAAAGADLGQLDNTQQWPPPRSADRDQAAGKPKICRGSFLARACFQLNFKGNKHLDRQRMGVTGISSRLSDLSYSCEQTAGSGHETDGSASSVLVSERPVVARSFTYILFFNSAHDGSPGPGKGHGSCGQL